MNQIQVASKASEMLQVYTPEFSPGQIVTRIWVKGRFESCEPIPHENVVCPMCGSRDGYRVPDVTTVEISWSCKRSACVTGHQKNVFLGKVLTAQQRLENCGLPPIMQNATFEDWKHPEEQRRDLQAWVIEPQGACILSGIRGVGKTYITACMLEEYTRVTTKRAVFMDVVAAKYQWLAEIRGNADRVLTSRMTESDMLVLDDLDKVKPSDSFYEFLYLIINSRYTAGRPSIITTNLGFDELHGHLGDAIASRLFAKGGLFIEVQGKDLRQ